MATREMMELLPKLVDDDCKGVPQERIVVQRDDEKDIAFAGTLLGSVASEIPRNCRWVEYRVYKTRGGKYVFSRIRRSANEGERDEFEAKLYDPSDNDYRQRTFEHAVQRYFEYGILAKRLYAELGIEAVEEVD